MQKTDRTSTGQFVKGQSGNPGGRPKFSIRPLIREYMEGAEELAPGEVRQRAALLIERAYQIALNADPGDSLRAIQWLVEQSDGKLAQAVNVDGPGGGVIIRMTDAPTEPASDN